MPEADINLFAVIVAALAATLIGFLWYSPFLFGKVWMKLSGFGEKSVNSMNKKDIRATYAMSVVLSLITAYVLAYFVDYTYSTGAFQGALTGFWIWLGFVAPVMYTQVLFEGKPALLYYINAGYQLVSILVMGAILAYWV